MKKAEEILKSMEDELRITIPDYIKPNIVDAMEKYASQFQPEWIKIESEEDLPKDSSNYWIFRSDGRVSSIDHYEADKKYFFPDLTASHYMPIIKPEPPKED